jgi:hypothetical protein
MTFREAQSMTVPSGLRTQHVPGRNRLSQASGLAAIGVACMVFAAMTGTPRRSFAQTPADDVAAQIRSQGYQCDGPVSATRDVRRSKPDSAVWTLKCRNAAYRVRLDPNMGARVITLTSKTHRP